LVGIALGSLFCEKLSGHKIEIGLVPIGAFGMTIFGLDFAWGSSLLTHGETPLTSMNLLHDASTWRVLFDLILLGAFGGFYCVPLYAQMQQASDVNVRARVIATNNILNALFMVVGAIGTINILNNGASLSTLFGYAAAANFFVTLALFTAAPVFLSRCGAWCGLIKKTGTS
jgi:hypothetical protein